MDPLDEVFAAMRVDSALYAQLEATAPWGLSTRPGDTTRFGLVLHGDAWLSLDDERNRQPVALSAGDCFVIPQGQPYSLRDDPKSATVNCVDVVRSNVGGIVRLGGGGAATTVLTGWFVFDREGSRPLLELLPPLMHVRMAQDRTRLLQSTLQLLAMETTQPGLGAGLAVSRLADLIFVQTVRAYVETLDAESETGWLAALSDRRIGGIASSVGYESEAAFNKAFKRSVGATPGAYRRDCRAQGRESGQARLAAS